MITYKELFKKSKEYEHKYGLTHYELLQRFMFERILERISVSKYSENFILKGRLLLSAMFGIDNRTTQDMDTSIKGLDISKENMVDVLNEILSIDISYNVKFDIFDISNIREDDEYGGNKYRIIGKLENLKVQLEMDISTGDKVVPKELKYGYPLLFENRKILINTYNTETILAEKIETILRRGQYNARMKDFYDVYMFLTKERKLINDRIFSEALKETLIKRESIDYYKDYKQILKGLLNYERLNQYWTNYTKKNKYASDIKFNNIIKLLDEFLEKEKICI